MSGGDVITPTIPQTWGRLDNAHLLHIELEHTNGKSYEKGADKIDGFVSPDDTCPPPDDCVSDRKLWHASEIHALSSIDLNSHSL